MLLTKRIEFSAAHFYWNEAFSEEENRRMFNACTNRHGHGHNYQVEVTLKGNITDKTGMIINFYDLDPLLEKAILVPMDHKNLNHEVSFFKDTIPTTENIALFIWQNLLPGIQSVGLELKTIKVFEKEDLYVEYDGVTR